MGNMEYATSPPHKCKTIAKMRMVGEREWTLGRLTERVPEYPDEEFCFHISTPLKKVVLLLNIGDMTQIAVFCKIAHGVHINPSWIEEAEKWMRVI